MPVKYKTSIYILRRISNIFSIFRVSVKAGTPGTHPEHPEPHPEPHPEHPEPYPEPPEPHPEHAGIQAMKQRTCFSINSRVSH